MLDKSQIIKNMGGGLPMKLKMNNLIVNKVRSNFSDTVRGKIQFPIFDLIVNIKLG